ncbi:hypothetical protein D9M69_735650 [compost metagenome]
MNSVLRIAASALMWKAAMRSCEYESSSAGPDRPWATKASFQARLSASSKPELRPRTPKIGIACAALPANTTRPWR